jgi:hypothetical protein
MSVHRRCAEVIGIVTLSHNLCQMRFCVTSWPNHVTTSSRRGVMSAEKSHDSIYKVELFQRVSTYLLKLIMELEVAIRNRDHVAATRESPHTMMCYLLLTVFHSYSSSSHIFYSSELFLLVLGWHCIEPSRLRGSRQDPDL